MLLNKWFEEVRVIDVYESFIWTDRYYEAGDFELVLPLVHFPKEMTNGTYLTIPNSEHVMIVEDISLVRDPESGNKVTITGRSLESILDRRVIYEFSYLKGDFQTAIFDLLNNSIISPSPEEDYRRIDNFVFERIEGDAYIDATSVDAQYFGVSLYEPIVSMCKHYRIGFKITLSTDGKMVFKLYHGQDNSLEDTNTSGKFVVFSEEFGNIIKEEYLESTTDYKNAAFIGGEGEGVNKVCASTDISEIELFEGAKRPSGLERREVYVDGSSTSSTYTEKGADGKDVEKQLTPEQYEAALKGVGQNELFNHSVTRSLNGEIETLAQFKYGSDFNLGDVVQIETDFAESTRSRIIEITFSDSTSGFEVYQTLQSINIGDYGEV